MRHAVFAALICGLSLLVSPGIPTLAAEPSSAELEEVQLEEPQAKAPIAAATAAMPVIWKPGVIATLAMSKSIERHGNPAVAVGLQYQVGPGLIVRGIVSQGGDETIVSGAVAIRIGK